MDIYIYRKSDACVICIPVKLLLHYGININIKNKCIGYSIINGEFRKKKNIKKKCRFVYLPKGNGVVDVCVCACVCVYTERCK